MIGPAPECYQCHHFHGTSARDGTAKVPHCSAFPQGIPGAIFFEGKTHHQYEPYPGDRGIRFQPKREALPVQIGKIRG